VIKGLGHNFLVVILKSQPVNSVIVIVTVLIHITWRNLIHIQNSCWYICQYLHMIMYVP